ncbi:MAG: M23 family metallopeptidase [Christensenellaceae bacterium]|nr:M23 family metallopeptidase [Christensenellaceae bacterium]
MNNPIVVEFPLRGEWNASTSPGDKIPSHGTNMLATRYAYDFIKVDWDRLGHPAYKGSFFNYLINGKSLNEYYCYGEDIYSPFDGTVVVAEDGYKESKRTNLFSDLSNSRAIARHFNPGKDDIRAVTGNYIVIQYSDNVYAVLCHLQTNSIIVSVGQKVKKGAVIAKVGHSGNSMAPHLHFQLMDSLDSRTANGLPCAFEKYEVFKDGKWQQLTNGIPKSRDRIRFQKSN